MHQHVKRIQAEEIAARTSYVQRHTSISSDKITLYTKDNLDR